MADFSKSQTLKKNIFILKITENTIFLKKYPFFKHVIFENFNLLSRHVAMLL